jgi:hypothetical protein
MQCSILYIYKITMDRKATAQPRQSLEPVIIPISRVFGATSQKARLLLICCESAIMEAGGGQERRISRDL